MIYLLSITGLALLVIGANFLVKHSSLIAAALGIPPLIIGLTIVAFGTSAPELAVGINASLSGNSSIVIGNVVGSNVFNVLFILGVAALISPLKVSEQLVRIDVPFIICLSILIFFFSLDGAISRLEGIGLITLLICYIVFLIYQSKKTNGNDNKEVVSEEKPSWLLNIIFTIIGLALLVYGSGLFVDNLILIAKKFNISNEIIGLTVVAIGTSMPEVVTSIVATLKGKVDIAVGNVIGSNIFNILAVLGFSCAVNPDGCIIPASVQNFDIPVMIAVSICCLPIFFSGNRINRAEGFFFMLCYIAYTVYLIMSASHHEKLSQLSSTMLYFVIPISLSGILISVYREVKSRKAVGSK